MQSSTITTFIIIILSGIAQMVWAQAPKAFSYQTIAFDQQGELIANSKIGVKVRVRKGGVRGEEVFVAHYQSKTNSDGIFCFHVEGEAWERASAGEAMGDEVLLMRIEIDAQNNGQFRTLKATKLPFAPRMEGIESPTRLGDQYWGRATTPFCGKCQAGGQSHWNGQQWVLLTVNVEY